MEPKENPPYRDKNPSRSRIAQSPSIYWLRREGSRILKNLQAFVSFGESIRKGRGGMKMKSMWKGIQSRMGYSDQEMEIFKSDPRNAGVLAKAPEFMKKSIVAEVVEAHGCISGHKVGERFHLDGAGNLISALCPQRMCIHAVSSLQHHVFAMSEMLFADVDPNQMKFRRTGCFDVGLECGGWGRVIMEVRMEEKNDRSNRIRPGAVETGHSE
jgi:uncharacterized repeat protein (TIGR04076 family)